jgi:O-antigen/teichoic acid export membrane protein
VSTARGLASSALLSTAGIGVQGVSRLVYTVLIGRVFGTEALGHASALLSLSIFAALLWPTAAGNTASRFLALALRGRVSDRAVVAALDVSMLVSCAVLGAAAIPVARILGNSWGTSVTAAALVVGYGAYAYARSARLGYGGAGRVAVWDSISAFVSLGLLVVVCAGGLSPLVVLPIAVGYGIFAVACWPRGAAVPHGAGPDAVPPGTDPAATATVRAALSFSGWNVLAGLTTNGLLQLAMIAAQLSAPGERAGVYAAAFTLATPASMLGQAVSQIVVPAFAQDSGRSPLRSRGPVLACAAFTLLAAAVFALAAFLAPWYLPLLYPAEAEEAVPMLRFLLLGVFVFTVALLPAALLLAAGRSRSVALTSSTGFLVGFVVIVATTGSWGVAAGTLGFTVGSVVTLVALVVLAVGRPDDRPPARGAAAVPDGARES